MYISRPVLYKTRAKKISQSDPVSEPSLQTQFLQWITNDFDLGRCKWYNTSLPNKADFRYAYFFTYYLHTFCILFHTSGMHQATWNFGSLSILHFGTMWKWWQLYCVLLHTFVLTARKSALDTPFNIMLLRAFRNWTFDAFGMFNQ